MKARDVLAALVLLVAGWALTLWVAPWSDESVNDLFVYRSFAEQAVLCAAGSIVSRWCPLS